MRKIQADYLFSCRQPMQHRAIVVVDPDDGTVLEIAHDGDYTEGVEQYEGALAPGFVNAHCHLELSAMCGMVPRHTGLPAFLQQVARRNDLNEHQIYTAIAQAEQQMLQNGIVAVGDISNRTDSFAQKALGNLYYHTFVECFALNPHKAADVVQHAIHTYSHLPHNKRNKGSLSPHAPYTASLELLLLVRQFNHQYQLSPATIHHQECDAENEMFVRRTGAMVQLYASMGVDIAPFFEPINDSSLTFVWAYFAREGKNLLVHNTVCNATDVQFMMQENPHTYWCFCPNANLYIENRLPAIPHFLPYSHRLTIGTDSLASNDQLCILSEMKVLQQHFPELLLEQLLTWATINGAELLNWGHKLGSIEVDKQPGINLISHLNPLTQALTHQSKVQVLCKAG